MQHRFLEITYRSGRPLAAYLYLPRQQGDTSAKSEQFEVGLILDRAADGRAIGVEITAPSKFTLAALNQVLHAANQAPAARDEVAPLLAASKGSPTPGKSDLA